jgi:hypothetical protein
MRTTALFFLLLLSACDRADPQPTRQEPVEAGRWTIIYSPHIQKSAMLLDTVTGKTWNLVILRENDEERYGWEPVERSNERLPMASDPVDANSN